ncbi:MAG: Apolipoprotein N-acyltransferase [Actinobacteria bacterium ADurb.Bin346]|nr:MAG: Apolipoprotein N-acyltransferase [Actinobacteria bacterium ADurb.Bin346]
MKLYSKLLLAILSSFLLSLSFIDNLAFLAWISLVPYFIVLEKSSLKQSTGLSWVTGIGFFAGITYWFTTYSWAFWFPIIGFLSIYFIFYGITFYYIFSKIRWVYLKISLAGCLWVAGELLRHRTFLAFPWGVLGYSQHNYLSVMQISGFTGVLGVSMLIVLFNLALSQLICFFIYKEKNTVRHIVMNRLAAFICIFFISAANLLFGFIAFEKEKNRPPDGQKLNIAMVQTNITFDDKYEKDTAVLIPEKYNSELYFKKSTELVVFPESIIWGLITREENKSFYNWLKDTAKKEKLHIIMGQIIWDESLNYHNVAALYNEDMEMLGIHRKIHPLPCAEYMPYPEVLWFLKFMNIAKLNITPSKGFSLINYPLKGSIGTNICFESTIQLISRTFRKNGANILFTFTDDAGFKDSIASWHHLVFSRVRAVENNSYMVHIGNNGISAIIDNHGRIIDRTGLVTKEVLYGDVYFNDNKSFYTIFGELLLYIYGGITFLLLMIYLIYVMRSDFI